MHVLHVVGVKGCSKCVHRALHTPMDTAGVSEHTKKILVDQGIVSQPIFSSLREQHFQRLMPKLTLGQHALLLKLWESCTYGNWRSSEHEVSVLVNPVPLGQ